MKSKKTLISLLLSGLLIVQVPLAGVVLADTAPTDTATTTPTDSSSSGTASTPSSSDSSSTPATTSNDPAPAASTSTSSPTPAATTPSTGPGQPTGAVKPNGTPPAWAFNDATRHWEATDAGSFSWDQASGLWLSPLYRYDSASGWYHVNGTAASTAAGGGAGGSGAPVSALANDPSNSNTGPGSLNNSSLNNTNNLVANLMNAASISNLINSNALSGNAGVEFNTMGGAATTGAASSVLNMLNLLNSMFSWTGGLLNYFIYNVFGDHTGDINIATPSANGGGGSLGSLACAGGNDSNSNTGPLSVNTAASNCNSNLNVNNRTTGSINNDVTLNAQSGNAGVHGNTQGGGAVSGDATAELNIINMINSSIGAGQMFFGMINIYGNLNGDILFPGLNLDGTVSGSPAGSNVSNNNTGPLSSNNAGANNTNNGTINNTTTGAFNNNIDASAQSGNATVGDNTSAGSAITGSADTNTNTFNLFDTDVFGDNGVLVLINDMGHWVGRIMNLPGGSSGGALLTSGATVSNNNTGAGSTNDATANNTNNANINNSTDGTITNNVKVRAASGNADVSDNTKAGDARSGNARVASNVANIFGSHLGFKHIFGILLVNVFGSWTGSLGVDTAAGNQPVNIAANAAVNNPSANQLASNFQAAAANTGSNAAGTNGAGGSAAGSNITANSNGASTTLVAAANSLKAEQAKAHDHLASFMLMLAAVVMMMAAGLLGLERKLGRRA